MSIIKNSVATAIALTTLIASTYSADAGRRDRDIALGIVGGLVVGAAIAGAANRNRYDDEYYDERPVYQPRRNYRSAHISWCLDRYRSYEPRSNTWISYNGNERICRSPYSR